jgi:hypothetical protein
LNTDARSLTIIALAIALATIGCGGDEVCGPGEIAATGATATVGSDSVTYGDFWSSPNNDCSQMGHPTSLTLEGKQVDGNFFLTFCIPRPDEIGADPIALDDLELIEVITVSGDIGGGCLITRDPAVTPTGTIEFIGYCDEGLAAEGYAIRLSGTVGGTRTCTGTDAGTTMEPITIDVAGEVAVEAI